MKHEYTREENDTSEAFNYGIGFEKKKLPFEEVTVQAAVFELARALFHVFHNNIFTERKTKPM